MHWSAESSCGETVPHPPLDAGNPPRLIFGADRKPQRILVERVEPLQPVDQGQRGGATAAVEQLLDFLAQRIGQPPAAVGACNREPIVEIRGNIAEIVEQQLVAARPAGPVERFGLEARRLGPDVLSVGLEERPEPPQLDLRQLIIPCPRDGVGGTGRGLGSSSGAESELSGH